MVCNTETTLYSKKRADASSQSPGMCERWRAECGIAPSTRLAAPYLVGRKVFGTKWRILFTGRFCRCTLPPAFTAAGSLAVNAVLKGVFGTTCRPQELVGRSRSVVQKGICCCPLPAVCCCVVESASADFVAVCVRSPGAGCPHSTAQAAPVPGFVHGP